MSVKALFLDLDGTVYFKEQLIPHAIEAIESLRKEASLLFLSNTDARTPVELAAELRGVGIEVRDEEVFTPVEALLDLIEAEPDARFFFLVSPSLFPMFSDVSRRNVGRIDHVVVADPRENVTAAALDQALSHLMEGADLIALQGGRYVYRADGMHVDTGAYAALLEHASGVKCRILGKPSREFMSAALERVGCAGHEVVVVGDDVMADVEGANQVGARSILVRTGKGMSVISKGALDPDAIVDSIAEVRSFLRESDW
jgi:HAD superfamily hydrolase (TIGR01458 family)